MKLHTPVRPAAALSCAIAVLLSLSACGGGGDGGTAEAPAATATFQLAGAYARYVASSARYETSGTGQASGQSFTSTGTLDITAPVASTFGGAAAQRKTYSTVQVVRVNGISQSGSGTAFRYYDSNYRDIGVSGSGFEQVVTMSALPATVRPGDAGTWSTSVVYSNSSRAVTTGTGRATYRILEDSASSVIVEVSDTAQVSGSSASTVDSYRLTAAGDFRQITQTLQSSAVTLNTTYR